jgi:predicted peptidase
MMIILLLLIALTPIAQTNVLDTEAIASQGGRRILKEVNSKEVELPKFIPHAVSEQFGHFAYLAGDKLESDPIPFRLYLPHFVEGDAELPLLVWLHGAGERGDDNVSHLRWLHLAMLGQDDPPRIAILAVQCPANRGWSSNDRELDQLAVVQDIVEALTEELPIDRNRVCLSGVSSGGYACWEYVLRHPSQFAAVVPISASAPANADWTPLRDVHVWAFYNLSDKTINQNAVDQAIEGISRIGGLGLVTAPEGSKKLGYHDCWTTAFKDYGLIDWLLAQNRLESSPSPGAIALSTRWKQVYATFTAANWAEIWPRLLVFCSLVFLAVLVKRDMHLRAKRIEAMEAVLEADNGDSH